jgi:hypothetical protein
MGTVNKSVNGRLIGLGLPMAALGSALCAATIGAAQTGPSARSPEALERVYACTPIKEDAARLACFDAAVGNLQTAQKTGEITAIDKRQAKDLERESFGFNLPSLPKIAFPNLFGGAGQEAPTEAIQTRISRVAGQGKPTFYFENGQVWQSVDTDQNRNARAGAGVTIRRGVTGSFLMSVEAGGAALRVRRIQ